MPQNEAGIPQASEFCDGNQQVHARPILLVRGAIFFYDLSNRVLPSRVGELHHAPSPRRLDEKVHVQFLAATFRAVRDVASCHNSSGFLAAPYVGCNSSGILRRADRRIIFEARRVGNEYPQPRIKEGRRKLWLRDDLDRAIAPDIVPGDLAEDL